MAAIARRDRKRRTTPEVVDVPHFVPLERRVDAGITFSGAICLYR